MFVTDVVSKGKRGQVKPENYLKIASACGAVKVLAKPFDLAELVGLVQGLIGPPPTGA